MRKSKNNNFKDGDGSDGGPVGSFDVGFNRNCKSSGLASILSENRKKHKLIIGGVAFLGIFGLTYLASNLFLGPDNSNAATNISASVMSAGYFVEVSSLNDVQIAVLAASGGTVASADDTVTVKTNTSGYKLYLSTSSTEPNSNKLYYNGDKTSRYALDPTESTTLSDNSWGFSLDSGATYRAVPVKGQEIMLAEKTGLAAGVASENNHTVKYGIRANLAIPAGRYNGTVTYSVVADASNQTNLAGIFPNRVVRKESGEVEVTIETPMMTNMDYGNWKVTVGTTEYTNVTASKGANSTMTLKFNMPYNTDAGTHTVTASNEKFGTYTAGNIEFQRADFFTISTMQEMTPFICSETTTPTQINRVSDAKGNTDTDGSHRGEADWLPETTLRDTRNNRSYLIRKLADGNCWMSQNLELDFLGDGQTYATAETSDATTHEQADANYFGTEVTAGVRFTKNDTDLAEGLDEWTPASVSVPTYATIVSTRTSESPKYGWKDDGTDGLRSYSYAASNADWAYANLNILGENDGTVSTFKDGVTGEPYEKRGNLYNWTAATLGSSLGLTSGQKAASSICPKGWRLPDNADDKSFKNFLTVAYGLATNGASVSDYNSLNKWPLNFSRSGTYHRSHGHVNARSTRSGLWTNTAYSSTNGYLHHSYVSNDLGYAYTQTNNFRGYGFSVRCVAR